MFSFMVIGDVLPIKCAFIIGKLDKHFQIVFEIEIII